MAMRLSSTRTRQLGLYVFLLLCLALVCTPRFNQYDLWGIDTLTGDGPHQYRVGDGPVVGLADAYQYAQYAAYFRGEASADVLLAPFSYRPLVPFLAALLPADPLTAINIVNILFLAVAVGFLQRLFVQQGASLPMQGAGTLLFVVSFPTFYYGPIGYIDAAAVSLLTVGVYFLSQGQYGALAVLIGVGALAKETVILLIPVAAVYMARSKLSRWRMVRWVGLMLLLYIAASLSARAYSPSADTHVWVPSLEKAIYNLSRPRAYLSALLSVGLPGVLTVYTLSDIERVQRLIKQPFSAALITGVAASLALFGYALLAAYADGRPLWTMYPFAIPLSLPALRSASTYLWRSIS